MENETGIYNSSSGMESSWSQYSNDSLPAWAKNTEIVYLSLVAIIGVPGNLLILIVQWKNTNHSTTDYLVAAMAVYELVCSGFNAPVQILRNTRLLWPDIGSTFLCKFALFSKGFATTGSSVMLAAIAVDRCIKTCWPLNTVYDENKSKAVCVGLAITSIVVASPYAVLFTWNDESAICEHASVLMLGLSQYYGFFLSALYFASFLVMFVCYFNIIVALQRRHQKKVSGHKKMQKQIVATRDENNQANGNVNNTEATSVTPSDDVTIAVTDTSSVVDRESSTMDGKQDATKSINTATKKSAKVGKPLLMEGRNLKKLTAIMFTISLLYMMTWSINWILYILGPNALGVGMFLISFSLPMINCTTNAVLFFAMSSRFRENAKKLLCAARK